MDDCSTDGSIDIIETYRCDSRVQIVFNEANSGSVFKQWFKGAQLARGEFVWIAESDDYAAPQFLEVLAAALDKHPSAGIAYCNSAVVDESGEVLGSTAASLEGLDPGRWKQDFFAHGSEECGRFLILKNTIPNASGVLFRAACLRPALPVPGCFRINGDWHTYARILAAADLVYVARPLNYYRKHASTVRATTPRARTLEESLRVREGIFRDVAVPRATARTMGRKGIRIALNVLRGRYGPASTCIRARLGWHALVFLARAVWAGL